MSLYLRANTYAADATVYSKTCLFYGCVLETNGTNNAVATFYDGNPGTRILKLTCKGADLSYGALLREPIKINNLLRFTLSGTGANVDVFWAYIFS